METALMARAKITQPRMPTTAISTSRSSINCGTSTVSALKDICLLMAMRRCCIRVGPPMITINEPMPNTARWPRSRERDVCPSLRVFCSFLSVAGRDLSWLDSMVA